MAEAGTEFERERWFRGNGEDVVGYDLAGKYECLTGHWP